MSRVTTQHDQLAALEYGNRAGDFIRFEDDPNDEKVRSVLNAVVAAGEDSQDYFRTVLNEETTNTLRLYAMRCTLLARRRASFNLIDDAIVGYALLPGIVDVPWDSWLKAALFVARSLGRTLDSVGDRFAEVALIDATARFSVAFESMNRVESLAQCRMTEVTTTHGTGFVETQVIRDKSSYAFYTAPRAGDYVIGYLPATNLAQLAVNLADALDATGSLITGPIGQDQLAASMFSLQVPGSYLAATGCLSFVADSSVSAGSFSVFVAELPEETDMDELFDGAALDGQVVFVNGLRVILMVAQPSFDDDVDVAIDLAEYVTFAQKAFDDTASTGWHVP